MKPRSRCNNANFLPPPLSAGHDEQRVLPGSSRECPRNIYDRRGSGGVTYPPPPPLSRISGGERTEDGARATMHRARSAHAIDLHATRAPACTSSSRARKSHAYLSSCHNPRLSPPLLSRYPSPPLPSPPLPRCIMDRIPMVPTGNIATLEASVARTTVRVHRVYMEIFPRKKHGSVSRSPLPPARPPPPTPSLPPAPSTQPCATRLPRTAR